MAVFAVFAFHAFPKLKFLKGGFVGVDVFFVISGFLISSIIYTQLSKGTFSFWDFYSRRIRRIYPVLLTVLVACLGFGWFYLLADEYMQLGKHIASGAGFVSNFVLFFEKGYFDNASATKPLLHFWSLGIEEQFYIFWPFILWITYKIRKNAMFWVALVLAVISLAMNLYWFKTKPEMDFFLPHTRIWELLCGAMLAWGNLHWKEKAGNIKAKLGGDKFNHILSVVGFLLLVISIACIKERHFPGYKAILPIVATVLIILAGQNGILNKWILSNKVLVWFGLISYPMYLWHWPIISMKRIVSLEAPSALYCTGAFVACTILAWLTTKLIENPLRFGGYGKQKTIGLFLVMMVIGGIGYGIFARGGLPKRFPDEILALQDVLRKDHRSNSGFFDVNTGKQNPCHSHGKVTGYKECRNLPENSIDSNKRTVVIWGDSHAAAFIPGFMKQYSKTFNIVQRTGPGCAAVGKDGGARPECKQNNQYILNEILELKPYQVILPALWSAHRHQLGQLQIIIGKLKQKEIDNVLVIGPVPVWREKLPKELARYWIKNNKFPNRLNKLHKERTYITDKQVKDFCSKNGIAYLSPVQLLCNEHGCETTSDGRAESVLYFDAGHLTDAGSEYLIGKMKNELNFLEKDK